MALYDGFFDAALNEDTNEYDRTYDASDFTCYFGEIVGSGVCVFQNLNSMSVRIENGAAVVAPGYLFIRGYWLKNDEDYMVTLPEGSGARILAHLNLGQRLIEIMAQEIEQDIPSDSLMLALVDSAGAVQDTRGDPDLCGMIDALGNLSGKLEYVLHYIDTEIESKLAQAEKDIDDKSEILDQKITEVSHMISRLEPPPIGSLKYSAADMGSDWLKCDGRFVSEEEYPELVALIRQYMPDNLERFYNAAGNSYTGDFSTSCIYDGYLWVYWISEKTILGFSMSGEGTKQIAQNGQGFSAGSADTPVVLSICGGMIFLAQYTSNLNAVLMAGCEFDKDAARLDFTTMLPDTESLKFAKFNTVPEVSYTDGYFSVALGITTKTTSGIITGSTMGYNYYCYIASYRWTFGGFENRQLHEHEIIRVETDASTDQIPSELIIWKKYWGSWFRWNRKCSGELVSGYTHFTSWSWGGYGRSLQILSSVHDIYKSPDTYSAPYINRVPQETQLVSLTAGNDMLITRCFIKNRNMAIRICTYNPLVPYASKLISYQGGTGSLPPDDLLVIESIQLPSNAKVFLDSVLYIEDQNLWIIFVGTGFLFSSTPMTASSWKYFSTVDVTGVITQSGCVEYDAARQILCISGRASDNAYRAGIMKFDNSFDFSSDGILLPLISAIGIPAYIKARNS